MKWTGKMREREREGLWVVNGAGSGHAGRIAPPMTTTAARRNEIHLPTSSPSTHSETSSGRVLKEGNICYNRAERPTRGPASNLHNPRPHHQAQPGSMTRNVPYHTPTSRTADDHAAVYHLKKTVEMSKLSKCAEMKIL